MMDVAGFVLTGGQSTRMGEDKALLSAGSQTLCEHIGDVLGLVAERVFLVGHPERYKNLKYSCLADVKPDLGPLSGLETALSLGVADFNILSSCDSYNLNPDWLRTLLSEARQSDALCTVAQDTTGQLQPLCAVYRLECLPIISKAISERRLRAMDLILALNSKVVRVSGTILNLNTREAYSEILKTDGRI